MNITQRTTHFYTPATRRLDPLGIVLHDTETAVSVAPHSQGSWHYDVDRDGNVRQWVNDYDYAWHVRACDEWRPPWMRARDNRVSECNSCTVGIELVSSAHWRALGEPYSDAQYAAVRALLGVLYGRYGALPVVSHGSMQLDRTDPVQFDYARAGLVWAGDGYRYEPTEEEDEVSPEDQAILDVMHGLGANAASVEGWVNEIGALSQRVKELEAQVAQPAPGEPVEVAPRRVEVQMPSGAAHGYVPET